MAAIVPSFWPGIGSTLLSGGMKVMKLNEILGPSPKLFHALLFGTTISLVDRTIEYATRESFKESRVNKGGSIALTTLLIGVKILTPYVLRYRLEKILKIEIPKSFIHIENAIFVAAIADGEFENLAARCFPVQWVDHENKRFSSIFFEIIRRDFFLPLLGSE